MMQNRFDTLAARISASSKQIGGGWIAAARDHPLAVVILLAITVRLGVFVMTAWFPITDEHNLPVSPLHAASGGDLASYRSVMETVYFSDEPLQVQVANFLKLWGGVTGAALPPLFPVLLYVFDYTPENSLPLALLYLAMGIALVSIWLCWLHARQLPMGWLIAFSLLPFPIWHTIKLGNDLPFALGFAAFFMLYFKQHWSVRDIIIGSFLLLILLLTRPTGIAVLLFVLLDLTRRMIQRQGGALVWLGIIVLAVVLVAPGSLFYFTYFKTYIIASQSFAFFGIPAAAYLEGIFPFMPQVVDVPLSWLALLGAKTLYYVGLRPSYSDIEVWKLALRAAPGVVLLPGLVVLFWKGDVRYRLLVGVILLPMVLGAAQERYNFAIQPLLFYFGTLSISRAWATFRGERSCGHA